MMGIKVDRIGSYTHALTYKEFLLYYDGCLRIGLFQKISTNKAGTVIATCYAMAVYEKD